MTRSVPPATRPHRLQAPLLGPEDVERPRLTAAIRGTVPSGTCVLSAAPGFGATTAVAHALSDTDQVAWVGLDDLDATPLHMWAQVVAAISSMAMDARPPALVGADEADVLSTMPALVDWIASTSCAWLVLDDVRCTDHASWLPALGYLIENLPRSMRLVLTTSDAPTLLPVNAADRRLTVIDGAQLHATTDEATSIVLGTAPLLDIDSIEEITATAQGWVAAVRLAARHAANHPDDNASHWLTSQGATALLEPWLAQLSSAQRDFLADTLFLGQLCGPLCDAALESTDSAAMLETLETRGCFLNPAPAPVSADATRWWVRHPLLSAALAQLSPRIDDADRDLRAAAWFEAHGDFESTMRHLLAAGRLDAAGEYLSAHENALFEEGKADRAAAWYASLPADAWGPINWHLLRTGWGQALSTNPRSADATLAQLKAHLVTPAHDTDQRVLEAEAAALGAYLGSLAGDTAATITNARRAIELFCDESPENSQQVAPNLLIRALLWNGDTDAARRELTRIRFQPFPTGLLREVSLESLKAQCLIDEGHIPQARRAVARASTWLVDHDLAPQDVSQFSLMTADGASLLELGDTLEGLRVLQACAQAALTRQAVGDACSALLWQARAQVVLGMLSDALACVHTARRLLHESAPSSPMMFRIDLVEAFVRHVGGDPVRAERLVQRVPSSDARTLMWARVTMHRQASGVRRSLAALQTSTPRIEVDKQVLLAQVALKLNQAVAEGHLARAADLAGTNGMNLALLGSPAELLDVAASLASRTSHDVLTRLVVLARPQVQQPLDDDSAPNVAASPASPPLSAGELELITFLPRRDTNADIARQLGVSVNTIKTRLYRMYRKLGVDSRDEAIAVARSRGLLT